MPYFSSSPPHSLYTHAHAHTKQKEIRNASRERNENVEGQHKRQTSVSLDTAQGASGARGLQSQIVDIDNSLLDHALECQIVLRRWRRPCQPLDAILLVVEDANAILQCEHTPRFSIGYRWLSMGLQLAGNRTRYTCGTVAATMQAGRQGRVS